MPDTKFQRRIIVSIRSFLIRLDGRRISYLRSPLALLFHISATHQFGAQDEVPFFGASWQSLKKLNLS